jgi:hypothetical protein
MKLTTNYSLKKPEGSDVVNIDDFNYNADIIDNAIQEIKNTSSTNKTNISSLQAKVDNGQNYKLTRDNGEPKVVSSGTFDDIRDTGIYTCHESVGGAKPNPNYGGYYYLEVINADTISNNWITQRATMFEGVGHGVKVYTRVCQNGTWSEWREL